MPPGNNYIYNFQVLSESVGKAVMLVGGPEAQETAKFVLMFDKFFDALNVGDFYSGQAPTTQKLISD